MVTSFSAAVCSPSGQTQAAKHTAKTEAAKTQMKKNS